MPPSGFVTWAIDEDELRPSRLTHREISRATTEFAETSGGEHFLTAKGFPDVATAIQQILLRAEISTPMKNLRKVLKIVLNDDDPSRIGLSEFILLVGYLKSLTKTKIIDSSSSSSSDDNNGEEENNGGGGVDETKNFDKFALATLKEQKSLNSSSMKLGARRLQSSGNFSTLQQQQQQQPNAIDLLNRGITIAEMKQQQQHSQQGNKPNISSSMNDKKLSFNLPSSSPGNNNATGVSPTKAGNIHNVNFTSPHQFPLQSETASASSTPSNQLNISNQFMPSNNFSGGTHPLIQHFGNASLHESYNSNNNDMLAMNRSLPGVGNNDDVHYLDVTPQSNQHKPKFVTRKRVELFEASMTNANGSGSSAGITNPDAMLMLMSTNNDAAAASTSIDRQQQQQLQQAGLSRANRSRQKKFIFSESMIGNIQNVHGVGYVDRYKLREGDFEATVTKKKLKDVLRRHVRSVERVKRDQYHMAVHGMGGTLMDERKPFKAATTVFTNYRFEPAMSHEMTGLPLFVSGRPVPKKIRDVEEQKRIAAVRRGDIEGAGRSRARCRTCTPDCRPNRFDVAAGRVSPRQLNFEQNEKNESKQRQIRRLSLMMSPSEAERGMLTPPAGISSEPSGMFSEEFSGDFSLTPAPLQNSKLQKNNNNKPCASTPQPYVKHSPNNNNNNNLLHTTNNSPDQRNSEASPQSNNNQHKFESHRPEKLPPVMSKSLKADAANRVYGTRW